MSKKLTFKQEQFIKHYLSKEVSGNATEAARRAGYKGNDNTVATVGDENLRKPAIAFKINEVRGKAAKNQEVTVENVLREIGELHEICLANGKVATAAKCLEMKGRYQKMFTDRIEHVQNIDDVPQESLLNLLNTILESGNVDLSGLTALNGSDNGVLPNSQGTPTSH